MNETEQTLVTIEPKQPAQACVIWLHGLGASGHDFEPIVPYLDLPDDLSVRFLFPHAPMQAVTVNDGMVMPAWYDILEMDIGRKIDLSGMVASSNRIADLIDTQIANGIPAERIVLIGFSQGGAVAYHTGLSYSRQLAGIAGLSTYLGSSDLLLQQSYPDKSELPIWIAHGKADPVVPLALGQEGRSQLESLGFSPQWHEYMMQHEVCLEEIQALGAWLISCLRA
ncbi:alpha/beta hydrolase [Pontibacter sp. JAM-7]|uniref:alpha/beta hydrolase n=1 Tax=Pontibacter sp. JAM-7 TaxID=3366581 RepID=UPI003AF8758C